MASVKFLSGSYAQYVSLTQKSDDTLYFLSNGQLFKGSVSYSDQIVVVSALPSTLIAGKVYVNTTDKSVTYYDGTTSTVVVPATVGTIGDATPDTDLANVKAIKDFVATEIGKIPAAKDYTVTLVDETTADGELTKQTIKQGKAGSETDVGTIVVPDLKMEVKATPNDGYLKTYQFTYGTGSTFEIDIPKDLVVKNGEVIVVTDDAPVSGLINGTYLKLVIANQNKPVYIDVKDLGGKIQFPSIDPTTKHWIIDGVDSGVVAEGKSIKSITSDENKNIIVTFTDNTTQNIGKLSVDIQGDFLTEGGFGNLRYYNGHFQYYNTTSSAWVDTSVTPDNVFVINMMPQSMKKMFGCYDVELGKYKLKFEEPDDTVINGQAFCIIEKVIIRRKIGSVPLNENDGDLVIEVKRSEFGQYKNKYYVDTALTANIDDVYYYKAFPMSTTGFYNTSNSNETIGIKCKDYNLYGFKLDQNESDPASMITYLSDCDNAVYKSAYMDYTADTFNYGDWDDAWFIKKLKPCMLKYDGTVDYELDKNDYTKKADGTDSDVANTAYDGNAMVGIPKIYWKIVDNGDDTANVYFCDKKIDNDFVCWSHVDNNGNEIDYCYMSIYCGSVENSTLRSLSDRSSQSKTSGSSEITYAIANNKAGDLIWYTEIYSDRMLINLLLLLLGKSTNSQTIFGFGNTSTSSAVINTGKMNTKGLFWGSNNTTSGVKIFGMENWWGNQWRRIAGCVLDNGIQKVKMTYGQSDGSTINGYNSTGSGYISINNSTADTSSGSYISKMLFCPYGIIPIKAIGSATTYYTDGLWFKQSGTYYALCGGCVERTYISGALTIDLSDPLSYYSSTVCSAISCKPLAPTP